MTTDTALAKISLDEQMEAARAIGGERGEAILATLQSIKDAGDDVVEPKIYTKTFLRGSTMEEHDVVLMHDYDTLLSAYKRVCVERDGWENKAGQYMDERDKAEASNKRLVDAIKNLRDVKGRHHTEIATTQLFEALAKLEKP